VVGIGWSWRWGGMFGVLFWGEGVSMYKGERIGVRII
jgi:hypothetical protein